METVVVTADRSARRLAQSTAAVSVIQGEDLRRQPITGLADALRLVPGFAFLNLDGLGYAPQAVVRGFYGGGEAEYVFDAEYSTTGYPDPSGQTAQVFLYPAAGRTFRLGLSIAL